MSRNNLKNQTRRYYIWLTLAALLYALVTLIAPLAPGARTYNLSEFERHLVQLTVIVPVVAIWFTALYGAVRLKEYSLSIKTSKDGSAMNQIANGLLVLVGSLVLPTLLGAFRPIIIDLGWTADWTVTRNYLTLGLVLLAFYIVYRGASNLLEVLDKRPNFSDYRWFIYGIPVLLLVGYIALIFNNPYRNDSPDPTNITSFYLPDAAILITMVLPYVIVWFWGIAAGIYIRAYSNYIEGTIYRRGLSRVSQGILAVIAFSVVLQFFTAAGPILREASLSIVLVVVYVILLLWVIGYLLIARGARRLAKIEEVTG